MSVKRWRPPIRSTSIAFSPGSRDLSKLEGFRNPAFQLAKRDPEKKLDSLRFAQIFKF
jgi:hypothetical protein